MPDNDSTDMLMAVKGHNGDALAGQGKSALDAKDTEMLSGFSAGFFSEIQDITFGIGVEDSESANSSSPGNALHSLQEKTIETLQESLQKVMEEQGSSKMPKMGSARGKSKQFKNFVDYGEVTDADGNPVYSTVFDPITVTRQIDQMSPFILLNCANQSSMKSIVVVKRKFTGLQTSHEAYVRLEFGDCLITAVDWDHGDTFTEKVKFVYRTLTVKYRPQKNDGTLDAVKTMTYSLAVEST